MPRLFSGKVVLCFLFLLVLDVSVMPILFFDMIRPIFLYLWILYVALKWRWEKTVFAAFSAGLLRDLTGSQPLGVETTVLVFFTMLLLVLAQKVDRDSVVVQFLLCFGFVAGALMTNLVLSSLLTGSSGMTSHAFAVCFSSAFASSMIMPVFFQLCGALFKDQSNLRQYELF